MLSSHERATLNSIQGQLTDDPEFEQFFRARVAAPPRTWSRSANITAGVVAPLGGFMMVIGSFGAAASLIAAAIALVLISRIGNP